MPYEFLGDLRLARGVLPDACDHPLAQPAPAGGEIVPDLRGLDAELIGELGVRRGTFGGRFKVVAPEDLERNVLPRGPEVGSQIGEGLVEERDRPLVVEGLLRAPRRIDGEVVDPEGVVVLDGEDAAAAPAFPGGPFPVPFEQEKPERAAKVAPEGTSLRPESPEQPSFDQFEDEVLSHVLGVLVPDPPRAPKVGVDRFPVGCAEVAKRVGAIG